MKNYQTDKNMKLPVNTKDLAKMEAELKAVENEPGFDEMVQRYTGPDTGLEYDDKAGKLNIVPGWHADESGKIVKD